MKTRTILTLIASVSLGALNFAHAQEPPPPPPAPPAPEDGGPGKPPGHGPMDHKGWGKGKEFRGGPGQCEPGKEGFEFGRMLQLTPEQKVKAKAIFEAQKPKMDAIRAEVEKEMRAILTPEQIAVLDNAKKLRESEAALRKEKKDEAPAKDSAKKKE